MKKAFLIILVIAVVLAAGFFIFKNVIVKAAFEKGLQAATGLEFKTGGIEVGFLSGKVRIKELKIFNPAGFSQKIMAEIPEIYIESDMRSLLSKKVHLRAVRINISELNIILNKEGKINAASLALLMPKPSGAPAPEIKIDLLELKVGKAFFANDVLGSSAMTLRLNNAIDEKFTDVTDPSAVGRQILNRIISRGGFSEANDLKGQVEDAAGKIRQSIEEDASGIKKDIESIFGR